MNVVLGSLYFDVNYKLHDKLRLNHNTEWRTFSLALFIDRTITPSNPAFQYHTQFAARRLILAASSFMTKLIGPYLMKWKKEYVRSVIQSASVSP
jgi:hypothetical protein